MVRRSEASLARKDYLVLDKVSPLVFIDKKLLAVLDFGRADGDFSILDFLRNVGRRKTLISVVFASAESGYKVMCSCSHDIL